MSNLTICCFRSNNFNYSLLVAPSFANRKLICTPNKNSKNKKLKISRLHFAKYLVKLFVHISSSYSKFKKKSDFHVNLLLRKCNQQILTHGIKYARMARSSPLDCAPASLTPAHCLARIPQLSNDFKRTFSAAKNSRIF